MVSGAQIIKTQTFLLHKIVQKERIQPSTVDLIHLVPSCLCLVITVLYSVLVMVITVFYSVLVVVITVHNGLYPAIRPLKKKNI